MRRFYFFLVVFLVLLGPFRARAETRIGWEALPELPVPLWGHAVGVHDGVLLVAGGTTVLGGEHVVLDTIYVLEPGAARWMEAGRLPAPRVLGTSVSTRGGVLLIGGRGDAWRNKVLRLRWEGESVVVEVLPGTAGTLPVPVEWWGAALLGGRVYVAGGRDALLDDLGKNIFLTLDLTDMADGWREIDVWPGDGGEMGKLVSAQGTLYFFGVSDPDIFRYRTGVGWDIVAPLPEGVIGTSAVPYGQGHILLPGAGAGKIAAYHTITDAWGAFGMDSLGVRDSEAIVWGDQIVLTGGITGTDFSAKVFGGTFTRPDGGLGMVDYGAIGVYFLGLLGMGFYFSRGEKDTETFFLGGRKVPWWAVGISIFGTSLSAITYLAVPANSYATNWVFLLSNLGILFLAPIVVAFYIPRYRGASIATAYEYLEQRFNLSIRIYGSLVFALFQMGRMGIVLFLPAIALSASTGMDIRVCILTMGVVATAYTVWGGIEAVIWTDVVQSVVLMLGAVIALIIVVMNIEGGMVQAFAVARAADKFHAFNWTWDMTTSAVWVCLIGNSFALMYPSTADQTVVQRYLATASNKDAAKAVWTNALLTLPVQFIFFGLGTALWVFFKAHPEKLDPSLQNDAILPLFIIQEFPMGLRGILIAGIFAAAMSSLDSSMNSLASVWVNDYYRRFVRNVSEARALWVARVTTVVIGAFGTGAALYVATLNVPSLFDQFMAMLGLTGGGLAGIFALGVFTKRGNGVGALVGAVCSAATVYCIKSFTPIHFFLHGMVGFVTALVVGYLASCVLRGVRVRN